LATTVARDNGGQRIPAVYNLQGATVVLSQMGLGGLRPCDIYCTEVHLGMILVLFCGTRECVIAVSERGWWPPPSSELVDRLGVDDTASSTGYELGR
jgi:hypothetical protein